MAMGLDVGMGMNGGVMDRSGMRGFDDVRDSYSSEDGDVEALHAYPYGSYDDWFDPNEDEANGHYADDQFPKNNNNNNTIMNTMNGNNVYPHTQSRGRTMKRGTGVVGTYASLQPSGQSQSQTIGSKREREISPFSRTGMEISRNMHNNVQNHQHGQAYGAHGHTYMAQSKRHMTSAPLLNGSTNGSMVCSQAGSQATANSNSNSMDVDNVAQPSTFHRTHSLDPNMNMGRPVQQQSQQSQQLQPQSQGMISENSNNGPFSHSAAGGATSTSLHISLSHSDMNESDWKSAVEAVLRNCQAEIVSLRTENAQLRSSLAETDRRMEALVGFTYSTIKANSGPNGSINVPGLEPQAQGPNASVESINAPGLPADLEPPTVAVAGETVNASTNGSPPGSPVTEPVTGGAAATSGTTSAAPATAPTTTVTVPAAAEQAAMANAAFAAAVAPSGNPPSLLTELQAQHDQRQLNLLKAQSNALQLQPHQSQTLLYTNSGQMPQAQAQAGQVTQAGAAATGAQADGTGAPTSSWSPRPDWSPLLKSPIDEMAGSAGLADKELMETLLADAEL